MFYAAMDLDLSQRSTGGDESDGDTFQLDSGNDQRDVGNFNSFNLVQADQPLYQSPVRQVPSIISLLQSQQATLEKVCL